MGIIRDIWLSATTYSSTMSFSSISSTFSGVPATARIQAFTVTDVGTSSTARSWPSTSYAATPSGLAGYRGATTSSTPIYFTPTSTSSFTLFGAVAGTAFVIAADLT